MSEVRSPVTGNVWELRLAEGAAVAAGDLVLILESMKMEFPIEAPVPGKIAILHVAEGDNVTEGKPLFVIE
jgi:biotin carboxyl carrier protein